MNAEMLCTRHAGHAAQPEAARLNLLVRDAKTPLRFSLLVKLLMRKVGADSVRGRSEPGVGFMW